MGVDIGPETIKLFKEELSEAKTILWNGPLGIFENEHYAKGTKEIALLLPTLTGATVIVGGGDSASAAKTFGVKDELSHVSTGGGASLEFLEGKELPGIAAIKDR
jgi:3-phosphoglycerate kinase